VSATAATAASTTKTKKVKCTVPLNSQSPATAMSGYDLGLVGSCQPFGHGVQYDTFTVTMNSATSETISGPFRDYFNAGTLHGRYTLTGNPTAMAPFVGSATYTGGTGAYTHAAGKGTLSCMLPSATAANCVINAKFTRP
jgi:hypothetical protein